MVLSLVACKGTSQPAPAPAAPVPAPAAKTAELAPTKPSQAKQDFVRVDREQLAALCLNVKLPPLDAIRDHGALALADGRRLPWLTVFADAERVKALGQAPVLADKWLSRASESLKDQMASWDSPRESQRSAGWWLNEPCSHAEAFHVVISGVSFDNGGPHVFAMQGKTLLREKLPASPIKKTANLSLDEGRAIADWRGQAFRRAFELTETLVGQPAKIATHQLGGGEPLPTVSSGPWTAAATRAER